MWISELGGLLGAYTAPKVTYSYIYLRFLFLKCSPIKMQYLETVVLIMSSCANTSICTTRDLVLDRIYIAIP